ncbi:MAG TPA: VWA domain-containing protein [Terriglobia bacterium]|nr:VWA domain-containing protein [Terriglobia bacterium]
MAKMRSHTHFYSEYPTQNLLRMRWFRSGAIMLPLAVTALVQLLSSVGMGQLPACTVAVTVLGPDLSTLPPSESKDMVTIWKQNLQEGKYELSSGRWDWASESWDFAAALMGGKTASLMGQGNFIVSTFPGGNPPIIKSPPTVLIADLHADSFVANCKSGPIGIRAVAIDRGARRMIFIVDNSKQMPQAGRDIEKSIISHILSKARAEDSFALLTADGPRLEIPFSSSREAIQGAALQLGQPPKGKPEGVGVLDAVREATIWFQPPRPGDSIILLARSAEGKHRVMFSEVLASMLTRGIRVFGIELGKVTQPNFQEEFTERNSLFSIPRSGFGNVDHLFHLCVATGGWAINENTERKYENVINAGRLRQVKYQLTEDRLRSLTTSAELMYQAMAEFYMLQIEHAEGDVDIRLSTPSLMRLPWARVYYPRRVGSCSASPPVGSAKSRGILAASPH